MTGRAFPWHKRRSGLCRHELPPFRGQDRCHRPSNPHAPWERARPRIGTEHGDGCCYAENASGQSRWHKRRSGLCRHELPPFRGQDRSHRPSSPHTPWERSRPRTGTGHSDSCSFAENATGHSCWHNCRSELRRHEQPSFRGQDRSHRPSNPHAPWERSRPRTGTRCQTTRAASGYTRVAHLQEAGQ